MLRSLAADELTAFFLKEKWQPAGFREKEKKTKIMTTWLPWRLVESESGPKQDKTEKGLDTNPQLNSTLGRDCACSIRRFLKDSAANCSTRLPRPLTEKLWLVVSEKKGHRFS